MDDDPDINKEEQIFPFSLGAGVEVNVSRFLVLQLK